MLRRSRLLLALPLLCALACGDDDTTSADDGDGTGVGDADDLRAGGSSGAEGQRPGVVHPGTNVDQAGGEEVGSCPCGLRGTAVRATVLELGEERVTLRVEERLHGEIPVTAGDTLESRYVGRLPCYVGSFSPELDQQVLAVLNEDEMLAAGHYVDLRMTAWDDSLRMAETDVDVLRVSVDALDGLLWEEPLEACIESVGDLSQLEGAGNDGDADRYWCVDDDGSEVICGFTEACPDETCIESTPCDGDDDCADMLVCVGNTVRSCPDALDASCQEGESDQDCADRTRALIAESCSEQEVRRCMPPWYLPCDDDASCGAHFSCQGGSCEPDAIDCVLDGDDCPEGWYCASYDGGFCEDDAGDGACVDNQTQVTECLPKAVGVNADAQ